MGEGWRSPSPRGARRRCLRATGACALERPRRKRGQGREAGVGVRVRRKTVNSTEELG
ncbi:hypothetical protein XHV734_4076 [Xanthomonas hortorum pv. vitians]|nr:hypothetical protein XHV734_4076 [Xanthomonas hortorum pv. vitians]